MTNEEFLKLTDKQWVSWIEDNLHKDPATFALSHNPSNLPIAPIATQIRNLQRSKQKLPSYYKHRCLLPTRAYEQASSEKAAALKSYTGESCLDLTCGLGVDSFHFSQHFTAVTSLEPDPVLAQITQHNFQLLAANNVQVHPLSAEQYIDTYTGPPFDLIYVDPDRRDTQGKRKHSLEDTSPPLLKLLPRLLQMGKRILVKLSPLFDLKEAWRQFPQAHRLAVISLDNECKEVLVEISPNSTQPPQTEVLLNRKEKVMNYLFDKKVPENAFSASSLQLEEVEYVLEPDVAFYKAGLTWEFFAQHFPQLAGGMNHPRGYYFSQVLPCTPFPGKNFSG